MTPVLRTSLRYYAVLHMQPNSCNSVFCRLREAAIFLYSPQKWLFHDYKHLFFKGGFPNKNKAELLFQADGVAGSEVLRSIAYL